MADQILTEAIADTVVASVLLDKEEGGTGKALGPGTVCSNCHARLRGRYCHICGQIADTYHRPVWSLFSEMLEGYLGLDGRLWRTIPPLLFKPGKITTHYLHGVRQPYMSPIRLFLLSSLLFFITFAALVSNNDVFSNTKHNALDGQDISELRATLAQAKQDLQAPTESAATKARANKRIAFIEGELNRKIREKSSTPSPYGTAQRLVCELRAEVLPKDPLSETCAAIQAEKEARAQNRETTSALGENDDITEGNTDVYVDAPALAGLSIESKRFAIDNLETAINNPDQYKATLGRWAPRLAFVLAPAYGLILALAFFWRRDIYLYDHMVVTLHFHSFLFLFLVLLIPLGLWVNVGLAMILFLLWSNYYLYRVMRRVYHANIIGAIIRVMVIDNVYLFLLSLAFLALLLLGIVFV